MTKADSEISTVVGNGGDGDGINGEDGGSDINKRRKRAGKAVVFGRAKQFVLSPFTAAKRNLCQRRNGSRRPLSPVAAAPIGDCFSGKRVVVNRWRGGGCFSFNHSKTLESCDVESPASDPNDSNFTDEMLKILIEKNVFYSKECNTHFPCE
ncbi:hypothetical protein HS088_TW11G00002 [Tripterygium wilfordii]|uniref:Uncharacterized protein n=1 Tax=Tripterygium wilfordii TaxID=458696 RepID=A0A7J7D0V5_TRIWF|nr:uncharacterized protein LOC120009660 [Tripterygium wilfordii]KAF5739940.1 hypothetical protein HS088_TW11G00002 [Tripterygium wilfordii]